MRRTLLLKVCISVGLLLFIGIPGVYAQEGGIDISKTENGDTVTYNVNLTPGSGIQAADYALSYKNTDLEFEKIKIGKLISDLGAMCLTKHQEDTHEILISFATTDNLDSGGTIACATFKKKSASNADVNGTNISPLIGIEVKDQYDVNNNPIPKLSVTGDNSVAIVASGKNINESSSEATKVVESNETIDSKYLGASSDESSSVNIQTKNGDANNKSGVFQSNLSITQLIVCISCLVVLIIMVVISMIQKKSHLKE